MTTTPRINDHTELDTSVLDDLDFEYTPECERPEHSEHWSHDGPAAWLMHEIMLPCGDLKSLAAYVCDGWKKHMERLGRFYCEGCNDYHSMKIVSFTPISGPAK
jgi:hypothetical protein